MGERPAGAPLSARSGAERQHEAPPVADGLVADVSPHTAATARSG